MEAIRIIGLLTMLTLMWTFVGSPINTLDGVMCVITHLMCIYWIVEAIQKMRKDRSDEKA